MGVVVCYDLPMGDNSYQGSDVERRTFLKVAGGAAATAAFSGVASAQDRQPGTLDDDRRVIVGIPNSRDLDGFIQRVNRGQADAIPTDASVVKYNRQLGYAVLTVPAGSPRTQDSLLVAAQREDAVKYAERDDPEYDVPDPVPSALQESEERDDQVSILATPSDPKFSDQYAPQLVNAPAAWDTTQGSSDVVISVVDQGALYTHPDLEDRFGSLKGKDFVDGDDDPKPTDLSNEYHGTHVAGICAASIGNGTGIAGMSNSTLLSCRALSTQGGRPSDIADAVQWSADQGADIINMSLGGGGSNSTMQNAINYAVNNGALPIAAAGNSGQEEIQYPAGYEN
jgi:serine protease